MTRLLIELKSMHDTFQEMQYHTHAQGFIYNLLRGSIYEQIHDTRGSKFFSFSNIFPHADLKQGDIRTFIISSPDDEFVKCLFDILMVSARRETTVNIGHMKFKINYLKKFFAGIPESDIHLITGTPIVIRINKERYEKYGYESIYDNFTYWRNEQPIDIFIEQLQIKLLRKYARFHNKTIEEYHEALAKYKNVKIFDIFRFKKQISTRLSIDKFEQVIVGSIWEFIFSPTNNNKDIIQFALDSGLGERNSLGFGFMNLMTKSGHL
ncbi:MAG: CRISPR-associated endoribonuclease Cas6 [Nitrososphaeraceae archaeon]